jgi:predicted AlkP superfamily phosphohydrolase/phosphomutase
VIDRFVELVDRQIAEVIAAFPQPPNVLIVSDHGEGAAPFYTIWRGWHATPGMFLAAGPDIPRRDGMAEMSYYDVAPTILDLERFEKPADLRGRSLLEQ